MYGYGQNNYGYQNQYQTNPYNMNQYYQQPQQQTQQEVLQGCIVDSMDVVKSRNCALDGSITYYPLSDKSEIYTKQLNPLTGSAMLLKYKLVTGEDEKAIDNDNLEKIMSQLRDEVVELKNLILEGITSPKGGDKK